VRRCLSLTGTEFGAEFGQPRRVDEDVSYNLEARCLVAEDGRDFCDEDSRWVRGEDVDALF
jgi:hypothetical protein